MHRAERQSIAIMTHERNNVNHIMLACKQKYKNPQFCVSQNGMYGEVCISSSRAGVN